MPLPGGPADKLGNRYELWWTVLQVQNLLRGQWDSIRVEVPGDDKVEFELVRDAVHSFHQAKRNAPNGKWTIAELGSTDAGILQSIENHLRARMDLSQVRAVCEAAMREYGMPSRIRTDNGAPFAGTGLLGLSKLSLGWMKMGIIHERIQPGRPQQNGRHERMHRTLKEETTKPAVLTLRLQQRKFDRFRQVFNYERPQEGLNNATPGSIYQSSSMTLPRNVIEHVHPKGFELRRVNNSGDISWHKGRVFISEVFRFEILGFEQVQEDFYKVYFRDVEIGEFDAESLRFRPVQVMR